MEKTKGAFVFLVAKGASVIQIGSDFLSKAELRHALAARLE